MAATITTKHTVAVEVARRSTELDPEGSALADELAQLRFTRGEIEKREREVREALVAKIGGAEVGTVRGTVRVELSPRTREGVDTRALAEAFPEAYAATRTSTEYLTVVLR